MNRKQTFRFISPSPFRYYLTVKFLPKNSQIWLLRQLFVLFCFPLKTQNENRHKIIYCDFLSLGAGVMIIRYPEREESIFELFLFELVRRGDEWRRGRRNVKKLVKSSEILIKIRKVIKKCRIFLKMQKRVAFFTNISGEFSSPILGQISKTWRLLFYKDSHLK